MFPAPSSRSERVTVTARALHRGIFREDRCGERIEVANPCAPSDLLGALERVLAPGTRVEECIVTHRGLAVSSASEETLTLEVGDAVLVSARRRDDDASTSGRSASRAKTDRGERDSQDEDVSDLVVELTGARAAVERALVSRLGASPWVANALARFPLVEALAWWIGLRRASARDLAPIYVLFTGFALIVTNLGRRRPGEPSAYSVFNEGFRQLPGQFNADDVDDVVMRRR